MNQATPITDPGAAETLFTTMATVMVPSNSPARNRTTKAKSTHTERKARNQRAKASRKGNR